MNVYYNNKVLSDREREKFKIMSEETIQASIESIEGFYEISQEYRPSQNEIYNKIMNTILDVGMFTCYTHCDCVIILKLFILSSNSYEKSLLRGKLKVLLNEGFKRLYGFNESHHKESYYTKLGEIIHMFPGFQHEYDVILSDLKLMSEQSTWWRDERNIEVHIDMSQLYKVRHEEMNESKVAMESQVLLKLFNRVNCLMGDINQTYINYMWQHLKM